MIGCEQKFIEILEQNEAPFIQKEFIDSISQLFRWNTEHGYQSKYITNFLNNLIDFDEKCYTYKTEDGFDILKSVIFCQFGTYFLFYYQYAFRHRINVTF